MDSIVVDGKTLRLDQVRDEHGDGFAYVFHSPAELTGVGKQMKYLRFGYDINSLQEPQGKFPAYAFVIGSPTPASDIPVIGTATYEGYALVKPVPSGEHSGFSQAVSSFNVDFGNKTLNGEIEYGAGDRFATLSLAGKIDGSSFSGTHEGITTQGYFYGPQAAELGGTFTGPMTWKGEATNGAGTFGAAKK